MNQPALHILQVWVRTPAGGMLAAGEIRVQGPDPVRGALTGAFRYAPDYLQNPGALPLDPIHLPLSTAVFSANRPHAGVHGVFEDALPDDWGRSLLAREHQLSPGEQRVPQLLGCIGSRAIGALVFASRGRPLIEDASSDILALPDLVTAAQHYEAYRSLPDDPRLRALLRAGSSPGGARPKALVQDADGVRYVAKFPSAKDHLDMVRIEAASLMLAARAGLSVPETRVIVCGSRPVLLSRRFDISPQGGRYHLLSFQTLLGAQGFYTQSYADLADVLSRVSQKPNRDLPALYRQIVFNALLGHTDDHLKNFLLRHDGSGYRLAPAFDLAPDVTGRVEHVLSFGQSGFAPSSASLAQLADACRLQREEAAGIRAEVMQAVQQWDQVFAAAGVSASERALLAPDLTHRIATLGGQDEAGPRPRGPSI